MAASSNAGLGGKSLIESQKTKPGTPAHQKPMDVSDGGEDEGDVLKPKRTTPAGYDSRKGDREVLALPANTQLGEWRNVGPSNFAGKAYSVAVDATNPDVVFAAYEIGGLWRTKNAGTTWTPVFNGVQDISYSCVKIHPQVTTLVAAGLIAAGGGYATSHNIDTGILLSYDGGDTWKTIGPSTDATATVWDISFDPTNTATIYAATNHGLYKTTDSGQTWAIILTYSGSPDWFDDAPSLAMHPSDPNTLLLAVRSLGVMRTSDAGKTWKRVDTWVDPKGLNVTLLAWAVSDPNIVYAEAMGNCAVGACDKLTANTFKSTDAGRTWTPGASINLFYQGRYDMSIAVDPADANHVIIANTSMSVSTDGLKTFSTVATPHGDYLSTVFAPSNPQIIYNGNDGGVWKSSDSGQSWARFDTGVLTNKSYGLAVAADTGKMYLGPADYGGIGYTPQFGWRYLDSGCEYCPYFINPHDSTDVYYGASGLVRASNSSHAAQVINPPNEKTSSSLVFDPADGNTIYVGAKHLWKSADRGNTWQSIGINDSVASAGSIVLMQIAPSNAKHIYAFSTGSSKNAVYTLWSSTDGGVKWKEGTQFYDPTVIAVAPDNDSRVYVGSYAGIYLSTDGGATAQQLSGFPSVLVYSIAIEPTNPSWIFAGISPGVLVSLDAGVSWQTLGTQLPLVGVGTVTLAGRDLFAGTDASVWAINLEGRAPCNQPVNLIPQSVNASAAGGTFPVEIQIVGTCAWDATSGVDWAQIETDSQSTGHAIVYVKVSANTNNNPRSTALQVAGQTLAVSQFGGSSPVQDNATTTIANSIGCMTFGFSSGAGIGLDHCKSGDPTQVFQLKNVIGNTYFISEGPELPQSCLTINIRAQQAGTPVGTNLCKDDGAWAIGEFYFNQISATRWQIISATSLLCLSGNALNGPIVQQICDGSDAQLFQISPPQVSPVNSVGSMAQLASGGGWDTTLTLLNTGLAAGEVILNFFDNSGRPLQLPFTFPQATSPAGPMVASTLDRTLNADSLLVIDSQQPANPTAQVGSVQLLTHGNVGGFAIFKYTPTGQEAVVPLETRNAPSYVLAFDNTGVLTTGVAIDNVATQPASIPIVIRDDTGAQIGTDTISLPAKGHTSFQLAANYAFTMGKRGTIEFDTPPSGQITALGLRANGKALTTLPVLADVSQQGMVRSMAHVASGGGWQTTFTLVNTGTSEASASLYFQDDKGMKLSLPLTFVQSGATMTATNIGPQTIAVGATLVVLTQGNSGGATAAGWARVITVGSVDGFAIFRYNPTGQEAVVPLETRNASAYVLAFDNTNGLATGVALANLALDPTSVPVILRDDTGNLLGTATINLADSGHTSFMLTGSYASVAGRRGTVEFFSPGGGKPCQVPGICGISVLGLRATPTGAVTTIPVLAK